MMMIMMTMMIDVYQESAEMTAAREMFGGRLSEDFIVDKVGHSDFANLRELEFPQSGIQCVILGDGQLFTNLQRFCVLSNNTCCVA